MLILFHLGGEFRVYDRHEEDSTVSRHLLCVHRRKMVWITVFTQPLHSCFLQDSQTLLCFILLIVLMTMGATCAKPKG